MADDEEDFLRVKPIHKLPQQLFPSFVHQRSMTAVVEASAQEYDPEEEMG